MLLTPLDFVCVSIAFNGLIDNSYFLLLSCRAYSRAELLSEFTSMVADYPRMIVQIVGKHNAKTKAFEEPQGTSATYVDNVYIITNPCV